MKKKKFKLGGITDPPKTYSWSSGKKPGKTAQIQNTQNSSISRTMPSVINNTIYEGKILPEAEVVASKIVTNPIDTFTNPYKNQPLGNQPFPFTYTDDTMIDDGYGYGHNNMWMSKTLDIDGYKKSNKTDGTSVTGHINDIMENYDELKTINPTLYLIKKNLSLPNEKQYSGKYADDELGDYFNNEKNYINKNIIPKGYSYRSINDDNSLIQSFTPNKDTLLGSVTLTPEMWQQIYNSKNDVEAKQKLFKMANVSEEEQKNFDNTFIHMNLNNPKKLAQYKKIKSKLENTNWDASTDKPTAYIKANGGKITNNMKKKKNNLPKYFPGGTVFSQMANQNLIDMNVVGKGVSNITNTGGGGFGQQLLGKVGGEIAKNIPGVGNIASDPLGSLVGLSVNSVVDMFKAIEEKERERRPVLKNINSVMAMGGKVDDMFNYLYEDILTNNLNSYASGGTIKIKPSKKGTFTKAAKSRGMGVQEFASKVLANKDNYSSAMVKKANFARNASKWKHDMGGYVEPQNVPVEVEGEEMYEMPNGQVGEFSGPKHENGGIPIELPEGTKIYSDRLTINGKTMAERKDKREKNISKLERLLSKNPQDKFIKSALQREKETFQQEEQQDMMVQEQMNNAQQQTEQAMMQMMMPQTTMGYGGMLMANGGYTDPPTNSPTTIKLDPSKAYRVPQLDTEGELTFRNVSYNEKGEPIITDKKIPRYAEYMSPSSHYANQYGEYINQGLYNLKEDERYQKIMQDLKTRYPDQPKDTLFKVADFYNNYGQFSNKKGEFVEGSPVESFGVLNTLYGIDAGKYYEQQVANMRKEVENKLFGTPLKWAPGSINPDNMMIKNETEELANGGMIKRADGSYSKRGLWDNIRANRGSGKKPTKQMLAQEKKIRAEEKAMGGYIYGNGGKLPTEILKARLESHMSSEEVNDYLDEYGKGGYVVRKSNDRKGKTHVVIGPDGTKKYFGDPKMGEKGKSKHGKEAFYARHKHNLKNNPYFRAYARATWGMGGTIPTYKNGTPPYGLPTSKGVDYNLLGELQNFITPDLLPETMSEELYSEAKNTLPIRELMDNLIYSEALNSSLPVKELMDEILYNEAVNSSLPTVEKMSNELYNEATANKLPYLNQLAQNNPGQLIFENPNDPLLQSNSYNENLIGPDRDVYPNPNYNNFTFSDETYTGLPKMNILGNKPESKEKPGKETKKNKFMEALQKAFAEATGNKEGFTEGDLKGMQGTEMGKTLPSLMTLLNRLETPKNINFFREFGQDALRAAQEAQGLASTNKYQQLRDLKLQENAARQRGRGSARGVNTLRALDLASDMLGQQGMEQVYNNYAQQMMSLLGQKSQLENVQDQMVMQGEQNRDLADRQDIDAFYTNLAENMATASEFTQKQGRDLNVKQYNDDILSLAKSYSRYGIEVVRNPQTNVLELIYKDKVISKEEAEKIKEKEEKK